MPEIAIRAARVIFANEVIEADLGVDDGVITEIGTVPPADVEIDGRGHFLAPALIDVHGDAFERQMMPRAGVFFPIEAAVLETDRQLGANGIATAYHALTLSWEPGLRAVAQGEKLIDALAAHAARLTVENRVQLRWETFCFDALPLIERALARPLTPSIAFNDHTSMMMRGFDVGMQDRAFEHSEGFIAADLGDPRLVDRIKGRTGRAGLSVEDFHALLSDIWAQRTEVPEVIARVGAMGRAAGAPMLSHDDTRAETRAFYRDQGSRISEFPMNLETARAARDAGDHIVFGAPNALRGGSHIGSPGAGDMVEAGLCDALASDYYYPAMLAAVAKLLDERRAALPALWQLVSTGPARMSGLADRGEIALGKRADLVLIEWPDNHPPAVRLTLSAGRIAYRASGHGQ